MEVLGQPDTDPENEKIPDSNLRILISNIGVLMDWPAAFPIFLRKTHGLEALLDFALQCHEPIDRF